MGLEGLIVITDRGGHLHNALMLIEQMGVVPGGIVTTYGPDIDSLKNRIREVYTVPHLFTWFGKLRILNPVSVLVHTFRAGLLAWQLKPRNVISVGASNVVVFCYWARLFGARIWHVECMNQVVSPSVTGRMLYPICEKLYVQWKELLPKFGSKAEYAGWVL